MSATVDTLVEMGFSRHRAEVAVKSTATDDIQTAMDWLLSHEEDPEAPQQPNTDDHPQEEPQKPQDDPQAVKSIKCDDCGKVFARQEEVEYHATKSGHEHFSESTEEKKALTEEERKEQLANIQTKLRQRRQEREEREKLEALQKEKSRIKSGKEMLEAKKKHEELEMKKIVEQRKREKEDERIAKQRVKEQIEQDKLARRAKFGGQVVEEPSPQPVRLQSAAAPPKAAGNYTEVLLQIRLTNGSVLTQQFGAKEPLSAVRLYIEMNRKDGDGPFSLMVNYPKKVFGPEDYDVPLESLGLGPRAILIVAKS